MASTFGRILVIAAVSIASWEVKWLGCDCVIIIFSECDTTYCAVQVITWYFEWSPIKQRRGRRCIANGLRDLVGDTPMLRIKSLSDQTGCEVILMMGLQDHIA